MASFVMPSGGYVGSTPLNPNYNDAVTAQNAAALAAAAPVSNLRDKLFSNLQGGLAGELPQDVTDQIRQHSAEFGVASGMPGSEFAGYNGLRNLGLTSLSRMQHAEDLLTPHFFQNSPTYQRPQSPAMNVNQAMDPAFRGTNSAPLLRMPGSPERAPEQQQPLAKAPDTKSLVGDFLAKYLPGGSPGVSTGMAPMGSGTTPTNDFSSMIPFLGSGIGATRTGSTPGFYAGSQEGYDPYSQDRLSYLADQGIIDPAFGEPASGDYTSSFTGDINSEDYGDYYG
jgi:hypothetical protein